MNQTQLKELASMVLSAIESVAKENGASLRTCVAICSNGGDGVFLSTTSDTDWVIATLSRIVTGMAQGEAIKIIKKPTEGNPNEPTSTN